MVEKKKSESRAEFQSTFPVQGQASWILDKESVIKPSFIYKWAYKSDSLYIVTELLPPPA
jgi:hypothetical protein